MNPSPFLGASVWYRSKTGLYTCPAIITAVRRSLHLPNVEAGHLRGLSSSTHVHLTVFTPGLQGHVSDSTRAQHPELAADDRPNLPAGGSFQEFDIPQWMAPIEFYDEVDNQPNFDLQEAGTWTWPVV